MVTDSSTIPPNIGQRFKFWLRAQDVLECFATWDHRDLTNPCAIGSRLAAQSASLTDNHYQFGTFLGLVNDKWSVETIRPDLNYRVILTYNLVQDVEHDWKIL